MKRIIVIIILALCVIGLTFIGCSKPKTEDPIKKYTVTFTFENTAPCYFVSIHDVTGLNDFYDSIRTPTFSKTIIYDYTATYRCDMANPNNKVSTKKINITYDTMTNTCDDSMYPSLNCWIVVE